MEMTRAERWLATALATIGGACLNLSPDGIDGDVVVPSSPDSGSTWPSPAVTSERTPAPKMHGEHPCRATRQDTTCCHVTFTAASDQSRVQLVAHSGEYE